MIKDSQVNHVIIFVIIPIKNFIHFIVIIINPYVNNFLISQLDYVRIYFNYYY